MGADGRGGFADVLAPGDEPVVDFEPVFGGQDFAQDHFGFVGCFGFDVAPAVGDAVDVGIDADARFEEASGKDEVGRLTSDALEFQEGVEVVGDVAIVFVEKGAADGVDGFGLGVVEADRIDNIGDFFFREAQHAAWGSGAFKQALGSFGGAFVLGAKAEESTDKNFEGVAFLVGHFSHNGGFEFFAFAPKNFCCAVDGEIGVGLFGGHFESPDLTYYPQIAGKEKNSLKGFVDRFTGVW